MKILHLNDIANTGYTLVRELRRRGLDIELLVLGTKKNNILRVHHTRTNYASSLRISINSVFSLIRKLWEKWDLIHVHYLYKYAYLSALLHKKYLVHIHGSDIRLATSPRNLLDTVNIKPKKYALKNTQTVIVSTPNLIKHVESIDVDKNVEYLPHPIDTKMFSPSSSTKYREFFEELHDGVDLLITSPLTINFSTKGQDLLVKTLARLGVDNYRLVLSSRGPDYKRLLDLVEKLDLKSRIKFIKPVPNSLMPGLYGVSDIVVPALSRNHVFGVTALEAMACKKPVVNTWHKKYYGETSFPEIHYSEKNLRNILELLVSDKKYREKLSEQQRLWVIENHSASTVAIKLLKIYRNILSY